LTARQLPTRKRLEELLAARLKGDPELTAFVRKIRDLAPEHAGPGHCEPVDVSSAAEDLHVRRVPGRIDWHCPSCGELLEDAGTNLWCRNEEISVSWSEVTNP
jgi:hypothetical protein